MSKKYKFTGVLNHEALSQLEAKSIEDFLVKSIDKVFPRLIKSELYKETDKGRVCTYKILAQYNIIDCKYNPHGELVAYLSYTRTDGTKLINYNINTEQS